MSVPLLALQLYNTTYTHNHNINRKYVWYIIICRLKIFFPKTVMQWQQTQQCPFEVKLNKINVIWVFFLLIFKVKKCYRID